MTELDDLIPSTVPAPAGFAAFQRDRIPAGELASTDAAVVAAGGHVHEHPPIRSRGISTIAGGSSYFLPAPEGAQDDAGE